jgi:AbrB family looped-hinge helix DNA binding protein
MRVTSRGQVTIPVDIRKRFGFLPGAEVEFVVAGSAVRLIRTGQHGRTRGDRVVDRLRGRAGSGLTTDAILALTRDPSPGASSTRPRPAGAVEPVIKLHGQAGRLDHRGRDLRNHFTW